MLPKTRRKVTTGVVGTLLVAAVGAGLIGLNGFSTVKPIAEPIAARFDQNPTTAVGDLYQIGGCAGALAFFWYTLNPFPMQRPCTDMTRVALIRGITLAECTHQYGAEVCLGLKEYEQPVSDPELQVPNEPVGQLPGAADPAQPRTDDRLVAPDAPQPDGPQPVPPAAQPPEPPAIPVDPPQQQPEPEFDPDEPICMIPEGCDPNNPDPNSDPEPELDPSDPNHPCYAAGGTPEDCGSAL
jgi:hypothetical protein